MVGESSLKSGNTVYFLKMFSGDWILLDLYDPFIIYIDYTQVFHLNVSLQNGKIKESEALKT